MDEKERGNRVFDDKHNFSSYKKIAGVWSEQ